MSSSDFALRIFDCFDEMPESEIAIISACIVENVKANHKYARNLFGLQADTSAEGGFNLPWQTLAAEFIGGVNYDIFKRNHSSRQINFAKDSDGNWFLKFKDGFRSWTDKELKTLESAIYDLFYGYEESSKEKLNISMKVMVEYQVKSLKEKVKLLVDHIDKLETSIQDE